MIYDYSQLYDILALFLSLLINLYCNSIVWWHSESSLIFAHHLNVSLCDLLTICIQRQFNVEWFCNKLSISSKIGRILTGKSPFSIISVKLFSMKSRLFITQRIGELHHNDGLLAWFLLILTQFMKKLDTFRSKNKLCNFLKCCTPHYKSDTSIESNNSTLVSLIKKSDVKARESRVVIWCSFSFFPQCTIDNQLKVL